MFFVAVRNFLKLCRYRKAFAILSGLSLAITALSFLVLVEKGLYNYQNSLSQEYVFAESAVSEDIISIYNDIVSSESLPEIVSISLIDEQCTGISCEASQFQTFIPYGRLFSQDEMEEGKNVVLLSLEYVRNLPQEKTDHIWDEGIEINGTHFDAVGYGYCPVLSAVRTGSRCSNANVHCHAGEDLFSVGPRTRDAELPFRRHFIKRAAEYAVADDFVL